MVHTMIVAYVIMAYIVMAYIVMACTVMAFTSSQRGTHHGTHNDPCHWPWGILALYRLYLGIADGMSIARAWACRYPNRQPLGISPLATETGTSCSLLCFMRPKHEQPPKIKNKKNARPTRQPYHPQFAVLPASADAASFIYSTHAMRITY